MRVLDAYCGRGGWSRPFLEDGDEVDGFDIVDLGYKGNLILADVRDFHPTKRYDLIIGSPPCRDFSVAGRFGNGTGKWHWKVPQNPQRGLELVREFKRIVDENQPKFWAMENVENSEKHINPVMGSPSWHFRLSVKGFRSLWSNFVVPFGDEYVPNRMMKVKRYCHGKSIRRRSEPKSLRGATRAEIPYPVAKFIADTVKNRLS